MISFTLIISRLHDYPHTKLRKFKKIVPKKFAQYKKSAYLCITFKRG